MFGDTTTGSRGANVARRARADIEVDDESAEDRELVQRALTIPGAREVALPPEYEECRKLLDQCTRLDEVAGFMTKVAQLGIAARAAEDTSLIILARRVRNEAKRKLGIMLSEYPKMRVVDGGKDAPSRIQAAKSAGINPKLMRTALQLAGLDEDLFKAANEQPGSVSESRLQTIAKHMSPGQRENPETARQLMRSSMLRALNALAQFTSRHAPEDIAAAFNADRKSMEENINRQLTWLRRFSAKLGAR